MLTKQQIEANLGVIESTIEAFNGLEITAILDYLGQVTSLQALATETQASAKYGLLQAINQELDRQAKALKENKVPPSIAKLRADAMCRDWHYLYEKAQRYASNISHTIDAVRSKISFYKTELEHSKY